MEFLIEGLGEVVKASLEDNESTVVSIFINPTQFAPNEDLSSYPRTFHSDLSLLDSISHPPSSPSSSPSLSSSPLLRSDGTTPRTVSALFLPPVEALYPGGITTDVKSQRGTFIEVKGLQDAMEGGSRPGFFRGVATVCLKLFNIVQVRPSPLPLSLLLTKTDTRDLANKSLFRTKRHPTIPPPSKNVNGPTPLHPPPFLAHHSTDVSESHYGLSVIE